MRRFSCRLRTWDQCVGGVPRDVAERVDPRRWEEDWRITSLPGRLETQRALVLDYHSRVARFGEIASCLDRWQPPALMLWGRRHDIFFGLEETLSWMKARMEAHILDGPASPAGDPRAISRARPDMTSDGTSAAQREKKNAMATPPKKCIRTSRGG